MKKTLLLTPGPTQTPPEICAALGLPIIHHRTPQFQETLKEAIDGLKFVLQTKNDVFLLASSGTGGMEAAVVNLLSPGDKAINLESGKFGERWGDISKAYKIDTKVLKTDWGKAVDPKKVKEALDADKSIKVVFMTSCETSTGVTNDVKAIAAVVQKTDAVLVVDAISSLGVIDLKMDEWGVDVVVSASHKGFMLPPGLGFVAINSKAYKLVEASTSPRFYFDLRKAKKAMAGDKPDTPFTPAIGIVRALTVSVRRFKEEGLDKVFAKYTRLAKGARAGVKAMGLELYPDPNGMSDVLTTIKVPANVDGGKIVKIMRDTYGISVAGGQGDLKGKIVRIAHMGCIDEYDILAGLACLEKVLCQLGHKFEVGAGVAAAQKVYND